AADSGAPCSDALGERPLWHQLDFELFRQELPLELLVLADVARDHSLDLAALEQNAQPVLGGPAIVGDDGQAFDALIVQSADQIFGISAESKASGHDDCAIFADVDRR